MIYVGNSKIYTSAGDGFNSEDYGLVFWVTNTDNSGINDTVTISVSGLTNTGIAKTIQVYSGSWLANDYPQFEITQNY